MDTGEFIPTVAIGIIFATLVCFFVQLFRPIIPESYRPSINVVSVAVGFYLGCTFGPIFTTCCMFLFAMAIGG